MKCLLNGGGLVGCTGEGYEWLEDDRDGRGVWERENVHMIYEG